MAETATPPAKYLFELQCKFSKLEETVEMIKHNREEKKQCVFVYTCDEDEEENVTDGEIRHLLDQVFFCSVLCDDECHGFSIYKWSSL